MELTLTISPELIAKGKNLHNLKLYADNELIGTAIQSLDEIETLELMIIKIEQQLANYRRKLQREKL